MKYLSLGLVLAFLLNVSSLSAQPQRLLSDGLVILSGTVSQVSPQNNTLVFRFTGTFSFNTYPSNVAGQEEQRIALTFPVNDLLVIIPAFGDSTYDKEDNPLSVTFKNALRNALVAEKEAEETTVVIFRPQLSFSTDGKLASIGCTHAQVVPKSIKDLAESGRWP